MICTCLQHKSLSEIQAIVDSLEMAEVRLDLCQLSGDEIQTLFSETDTPLIATCRIANVAAEQAEERLLKAIEAGAKYVDIEIEAPAPMSKRLHRAAREAGTMVIRSYHDFKATGSFDQLVSVFDKCCRFGADVIKIVTTANSREDIDRLFDLYENVTPGTLVAFCMGEDGKTSRLNCLLKGSPWTYATLTPDEATAPGQWTTDEISQALYCDKLPKRVSTRTPVRIPASKSFAQRAIVAATLAEGTSHLSGYAPCGDNESALKVAEALGAKVERAGETVTITGIGAKPRSIDLKELNVGESGLLTRLMIPVCSAVSSGPVPVHGEKTLLSRPLKGAKDIMASYGVLLVPEDPTGQQFTSNEATVPLVIKGKLVPGRAEISGGGGSQLISGLLCALPLTEGDSQMLVTEPKSIPYLFITLDVARKFGIKVGSEMEGGEDFMETQDWNCCTAINFKIKGGQHYHAADFAIEGDWSTAANMLVAGAVFGKVEITGLDLKSLQADLSIMDILSDAGACLSYTEEGEETDRSIICQKAPLKAFETDLNNAPDLFPIISVLAAFCQGESRIAGMGRLAGKESDRGTAILDMLSQMGVRATRDGDELVVEGHSLSERLLGDTLLRGGNYTSRHDHRMVMALTVASLGANSPVEIDDVECVAKSCPQFFDLFNSII